MKILIALSVLFTFSSAFAAGPYPLAEKLDKVLEDARASGKIHGASVEVDTFDGKVIYKKSLGDTTCEPGSPGESNGRCPYTPDLKVKLASATKWVTSTMFLGAIDDLAARGEGSLLDLETPIRRYLGNSCEFSDDIKPTVKKMMSEIKLKHLLSFTSGLVFLKENGNTTSDYACVAKPAYKDEDGKTRLMTLEDCACKIIAAAAPNYHTAGTAYSYGNSHHTVAGAMLEAALTLDAGKKVTVHDALSKYIDQKIGTDWTYIDLYQAKLRYPDKLAGLDDPLDFFKNPNLASGIQSSVKEYKKFLSSIVQSIQHKSVQRKTDVMSYASTLAQRADAFTPSTQILNSPWISPGYYFVPTHYGLNNFRECYVRPLMPAEDGSIPIPKTKEELAASEDVVPDASCSGDFTFGHPGKHGFVPWIDLNRQYFAISSTQEINPDSHDGTDYRGAGRNLAEQMRPYINAYLNRPPVFPKLSPTRPRMKQEWTYSFQISDPDRDEVVVTCAGCPKGMVVTTTPRQAGKVDQTVTLTWTPNTPGNSSADFSLEAKDISLNPKTARTEIVLRIRPELDSDGDGVPDSEDCAPNNPRRAANCK